MRRKTYKRNMQNIPFPSFSPNRSRKQLRMSWTRSRQTSLPWTLLASHLVNKTSLLVQFLIFPRISLRCGSNSKSLAHSNFHWGLDLLMWNARERSKCLSVVICFLANHFNSLSLYRAFQSTEYVLRILILSSWNSNALRAQ